jgi:hypothetical protein
MLRQFFVLFCVTLAVSPELFNRVQNNAWLAGEMRRYLGIDTDGGM